MKVTVALDNILGPERQGTLEDQIHLAAVSCFNSNRIDDNSDVIRQAMNDLKERGFIQFEYDVAKN